MNLLSHYAAAWPLSEEGRMGSVAADLMTLYRRKVRPYPLRLQWERQPRVSLPMARFLAGMRFHQTVDSHFHHHPLFTQLAEGLAGAIRQAGGPPGLKPFFPAHLLAEMHLDRLLMAHRPQLLDGFYRLFEGLPAQVLADFLAAHPQADGPSVAGFLERMAQDRFLEDYRQPEGLFYRLNRVVQRCRQRPLNGPEQAACQAFLAGGEAQATQTLEAFIQAMAQLAAPEEQPKTALTGVNAPRP